MKGENIVLNNSKGEHVKNTIAYLEHSAEDIEIEIWNNRNGMLYLPKSYKRTIKRKFADRYTRHFIKYVN